MPFDLSAFDAASRGPRVALPDELRVPRRTWLITFVLSLAAGLVGVALLVLGLQDWNRPTTLLVLAGVLSATIVPRLMRTSPATASRILRFADDNQLTFDALKDGPGYAGSAFTMGHSHRRLMVVKGWMHGHRVEIGNLSYRIASRAHLVEPGYVAIRLPARLPHVVMTSMPALRMRLGIVPRAEDRIALDADGPLRVYTPHETTLAVQPMLTAQAVETLTRLSRRYCIEILDDVLYLHARRSLSTGSARRWRTTLADVAEVCDVLDASPIWQVMRTRPKRASASMPRLQSGVDETRVTRISLLVLAAIMVVVTVLVVWFHDW